MIPEGKFKVGDVVVVRTTLRHDGFIEVPEGATGIVTSLFATDHGKAGYGLSYRVQICFGQHRHPNQLCLTFNVPEDKLEKAITSSSE